MATASTMILAALRMIGEKSPGGTLTSNEQTDYLYDLNAMMESLEIDRSNCYQLLQEPYALTSGTAEYTLPTRPIKIDYPCFIRDSNNNDTPVELIDAPTYGLLGNKSGTSGTPIYLFYDAAYVEGQATIRLYPKPGSGLTLYFNSWKKLQTFATISTTVALPPGYQLAIESNFALLKCSGYTTPSPTLVKTARDSLARIKSLNLQDTVMQADPAASGFASGTGRYNINNG